MANDHNDDDDCVQFLSYSSIYDFDIAVHHPNAGLRRLGESQQKLCSRIKKKGKKERKESPQTELHFSSSRPGLEEASQAAEDSTAEHNYSHRALVKESVNG